MNELRRKLLTDENNPPELPEDLAWLATRQASAAALLIDHAELYKRLYARFEADGPSDELHAIALDAAGNLSAVLGSLRTREDLLLAIAHAPGYAAFPQLIFDQLFDCFVLLSAPYDEHDWEACLTPEHVDDLLASRGVREWFDDLDVDDVFEGPLTTRFGLDDAE